MRENKFRGKSKETGEWMYGDIIYPRSHFNDRGIVIYIVSVDIDSVLNHLVGGVQTTDVIPATVGQYIGLRDIHGTEIFEGDIVKINLLNADGADEYFIVEWQEDIAMYLLRDGDFVITFADIDIPDINVVGNIHDNPDLLNMQKTQWKCGEKMSNDMICKDCHWFDAERMDKPFSNGKIYPCINIGVPGWDVWEDKQQPPETCADYCKEGEYVPTGVFADLAEVVKELATVIKEKKSTEQ